MNLILQNIVNDFDLSNISPEWLGIDFKKFSSQKSLFKFQEEALTNALKALYLYFNEDKACKSDFYKRYQKNGLSKDLSLNLSYDVQKEGKIVKYFSDYSSDFPQKNSKISFEHFINRMGFWMATGSGKTLVIVKLIELLGYLMKNNKIPKCDILFLTYRDDLIEQFIRHVEEFNSFIGRVEEFNSSNEKLYINLINLKDYESYKRNSQTSLFKVVDVYYYRSDLISDEQKEKIVSFKNYDDNGKWYILLDEAHKGDKDESKRQAFYSILSRNGFLFNFSATFTDIRDIVTCVYNFNLSRFVEEGYGKHIYISRESINALRQKSVESAESVEKEKQIILLKIFTLFAVIVKQYEEIKKIRPDLYHKPLLLTLVNSVNVEDSDLELFFREIEKIVAGNWDNELLDIAKERLKEELTSKEVRFEFESEGFDESVNIEKLIYEVTFKDIFRCIFNSESSGKIEILKIPSNKQELVLKLTTTDRPFGLMKIGDISEWLKEKLKGYEIIERYEDESLFKRINQSDDINVLMGSRSFYEGWDSNRPNVILFINIGTGFDAKKFVLQSIGRGVRIEPLPNQRRRAKFLYNNGKIAKSLFEELKPRIDLIESLFVFGTKAENLQKVVDILKEERPDESIGDLFELNPDLEGKLLLIPQYKKSEKILIEEGNVIRYPIHPNDFRLVRDYFNYLGEKVVVCKFDCDVKVLAKVKEGFNGRKNEYFIERSDIGEKGNPDFLLRSIFRHFSNYSEELKGFKMLEEEIIHFKKITVSPGRLKLLEEKINEFKNNVKKLKDIEEEKKELRRKLKKGEISVEEFEKKIEEYSSLKDKTKDNEVKFSSNGKLRIKYLANHYYLPIVLSEQEKIGFIKHIIRHKSEVDFINELEKYLSQEKNLFSQFDWWLFSKVDETIDEVYIPYYDPERNRISKFSPDFIFWLKKGEDYFIVFIDPKSEKFIQAERKIDGYERIFVDVGPNTSDRKVKEKVFEYRDGQTNVRVRVKLFMRSEIYSSEKYKGYWFSSIDDMLRELLGGIECKK